MIIAYVVDVHGNEAYIKKLVGILNNLNIDLAVFGGDLSFSLGLLDGVGIKYVIVPGECDDIYLTKHARTLGVLYDGKVMNIDGLKIGFVGALGAHQSIRRLAGRCSDGLDLLITHMPPKGCLDIILGKYHGGLIELLDLIRKCRIKYVLTGHYHDNVGVCRLDSSLVINPGPMMLGRYLIVYYYSGTLSYEFRSINS